MIKMHKPKNRGQGAHKLACSHTSPISCVTMSSWSFTLSKTSTKSSKVEATTYSEREMEGVLSKHNITNFHERGEMSHACISPLSCTSTTLSWFYNECVQRHLPFTFAFLPTPSPWPRETGSERQRNGWALHWHPWEGHCCLCETANIVPHLILALSRNRCNGGRGGDGKDTEYKNHTKDNLFFLGGGWGRREGGGDVAISMMQKSLSLSSP